MEKPKREETRTEAQQLEDLPVSAKEAAEVKGGITFVYGGSKPADPPGE